MQWIYEQDLDTWASRLDARQLMPAMIADLIRITIDDASRFRFPSGDAGQVRGWDGDLETTEAKGFVPEGKSKWEFGTSPGESKANLDYEKRTGETSSSFSSQEMSENTLVLVNLRCWNTPKKKISEWESDRRAEGKWKDVRYLDGAILVEWLKQHPAIAAKYARDVLKKSPQEGALSTDEYWDEFSTQFRPQLSEKLVVADRHKEAEALIDWLCGQARSFMLGAETSEEVIAFAVAAIRSAEPALRQRLESRMLIVRTEAAARFLAMHTNMIFIATGTAEKLVGILAKNCPTLSAATGAQVQRGSTLMLKRPTASSMVDGFIEMGLAHAEGYELAHRCGRSLTILKRLLNNGPVADPAWLSQITELKPALLAGGWSSELDADREVLKELGGYISYTALESILMPTLNMADRPIDREADVWQTRAPVDAFYFYACQLTGEDFNRLRGAIINVFGKQLEQPSQDQKFNLARVAPSGHSGWLRDGLALTLLIIASMGKAAKLYINGKSPQQYVDEIINTLPDWGKSHHSILRLGEQTALLAEVAPNPFLTALESMLEGAPEQFAPIFESGGDSIFNSPIPHLDLLWALEVIAWEPRYLNRAVVVLAKLGQLDPKPDSKHAQRPINSLRSILLGWSPNTYALQPQRIACLDLILRECPDVGWQLLKKLLPQHHDINLPTRRPKLRDCAPENPEEITFGLVWDFESAVIDRTLTVAGNNEERLGVLVKRLTKLQPQNRIKVLRRLDSYLTEYQSLDGCPIWHALKQEAARNEYFSDSNWVLNNQELETVKAVVERHRPIDPLVSERHAFDEWVPYLGRHQANSEEFEDPEQQRVTILQRVLERDGVSGVLRLAMMVKRPELLGLILGHLSITLEQMLELMRGTLVSDALLGLSHYVSAAGYDKFGDQWTAVFNDRVLTQIADDQTKAKLLLGWPVSWSTWAYVDSLGSEIRDQYWRHTILPIQGSSEELLYAVEQFQSVERDIDVLSMLNRRSEEIQSSLLKGLLTNGIRQVNSGVRRPSNMLSYHVTQILKELRIRSDVDKQDIAKLECAYWPVLSDKNESTIFSLLAADPAMFVDVLSQVFRGKNTPSDQVLTDEMKARAKISYDLLSDFKVVPGMCDGEIDGQILLQWVTEVRILAAAKGLDDISDQRIGYVLAYAPQDPDEPFWPPSAVCQVIEAVTADQIEKGVIVECFNKRGVYGQEINEGGDQERVLASRYKSWADATSMYPRTSAMLQVISEHWICHAEREDVSAEQRKMKT